MKFKPYTTGSWFTISVAALVGVGALIIGAVTHTLQSLVACGLASAGAAYIGWRYVQARQRLAAEHVAYSTGFDANVFAADASARERWNFGVTANIWHAFADVVTRMGIHDTTFDGLTIRVVSEPFSQPGLPGLNRGVTWFDKKMIIVAWLSGEESPYDVLCHELAHVAIERTEGIADQEEAHAFMRAKGYTW